MGHPLRIEYSGAWYHVMSRGAGRRRTFLDDEDCRLFLNLLSESSQMFEVEIHAFSLMVNHYHLLVHTPKSGLGRAMRHVNGVYTCRFNRRHRTDGPLFRGRYKARLVQAENYLLELVRYIHLNPVKACLVQTSSEHPWTSHRYYLQGTSTETSWLKTDEILSRFGGRMKEARSALDKFVLEGVSDWFEKEWQKGRAVVGSKGFCEWVYKNCKEWTEKDREIPKRDSQPRRDIGMKMILDQVAFVHDIPTGDLRRRDDRRRNDARSMVIHLARKLKGIPHKDLARWMGTGNPYAIAKNQQRFRERLEKDRSLRKLTSQVERQIWSNVKT